MPTISLTRLRDALVATTGNLEQIAAENTGPHRAILAQVAVLREITAELQTLIDRLHDTWG